MFCTVKLYRAWHDLGEGDGERQEEVEEGERLVGAKVRRCEWVVWLARSKMRPGELVRVVESLSLNRRRTVRRPSYLRTRAYGTTHGSSYAMGIGRSCSVASPSRWHPRVGGLYNFLLIEYDNRRLAIARGGDGVETRARHVIRHRSSDGPHS
ncbi:hypothetical protein FIBSPDRAFT_185545 [Athelia psychrophila]|uniref:Uncharacterized protein n=1 Tax=Athelia psychrophila TaxID=1759441 RepID=A0A166AE68_9AGAM|nr:hypothetical protein FIBSPDRAFT_185545 [Fibularhizoctonia sp. CBS 109695]